MAQDTEITTAEAAKILGVSKATVVNYADRRGLKCRKLPSGHRRYLRSDVENFKAEAAA